MTFGTSDTPSPPLSLDASPAATPSSPPRFPLNSLAAGAAGRGVGGSSAAAMSISMASSSSASATGAIPTRQGHRASASMSAVQSAAAAAAAAAAGPYAPRNMTPVSSFLSAKMVDPDGYPRSSFASGAAGLANIPKTRSLAEIVGDEFFFVRLHAEFCGLMGELVRGTSEEEKEEDDDEEVEEEEFLDEEAIEDDEEDESEGDACCVGGMSDDDGSDDDDAVATRTW